MSRPKGREGSGQVNINEVGDGDKIKSRDQGGILDNDGNNDEGRDERRDVSGNNDRDSGDGNNKDKNGNDDDHSTDQVDNEVWKK